jgi:hypothetical protein
LQRIDIKELKRVKKTGKRRGEIPYKDTKKDC